MPTYDYRCSACGHAFEHFQSIRDPKLEQCPKCGKPRLERLIGAGGCLIFKGSGFYITDYRSPSYQEAAKKESGSPAAPKPAGTRDGAPAPAPPPTPAPAPAKSPAPAPTPASTRKSKSH